MGVYIPHKGTDGLCVRTLAVGGARVCFWIKLKWGKRYYSCDPDGEHGWHRTKAEALGAVPTGETMLGPSMVSTGMTAFRFCKRQDGAIVEV